MKHLQLAFIFGVSTLADRLSGRAACKANNCARAITGSAGSPGRASSRLGDCSSFQQYTSYPPAFTVTESGASDTTIAPSGPVDTLVKPSNVPAYAKTACTPTASASARFASACSCAGVSPRTSTAPTPIATVITTASLSCSIYYLETDYEEYLYNDGGDGDGEVRITDTGSDPATGILQATRWLVGSDRRVRLASDPSKVWIAEADDVGFVAVQDEVTDGNTLFLETDNSSGDPDDPKVTELRASRGADGDWSFATCNGDDSELVVEGPGTDLANCNVFGVYAYNAC